MIVLYYTIKTWSDVVPSNIRGIIDTRVYTNK